MCTNADALMPMMSHPLFTLSSSFACPTLSHYGYKWLVAVKPYSGENMEKKRHRQDLKTFHISRIHSSNDMNVKSVPSCGLVYSALLGREAGTMSNKQYLSTLTKLIGRDKFPGACTWTQSVGQHGVVKKAISNLESLQEGKS